MSTVYRIVARDDNKVVQFREASRVGSFLLGRRITAYIVIKTDEHGDRVYNWSGNAAVHVIEEELYNL